MDPDPGGPKTYGSYRSGSATLLFIIALVIQISIFCPSDLHAILLPLVRCAGGARELHKLNKLTKSLWNPEDLRGRYVPYDIVVIECLFQALKKAEQFICKIS
jgi:hypothetical protein